MGRVVDLEAAKVDALARRLLPVLRDRGSLAEAVDQLENVERWRKAARRAARSLGWRIRTGITPDGSCVWAASEDYPVSESQMREAMSRMSTAGYPHTAVRRRHRRRGR